MLQLAHGQQLLAGLIPHWFEVVTCINQQVVYVKPSSSLHFSILIDWTMYYSQFHCLESFFDQKGKWSVVTATMWGRIVSGINSSDRITMLQVCSVPNNEIRLTARQHLSLPRTSSACLRGSVGHCSSPYSSSSNRWSNRSGNDVFQMREATELFVSQEACGQMSSPFSDASLSIASYLQLGSQQLHGWTAQNNKLVWSINAIRDDRTIAVLGRRLSNEMMFTKTVAVV